MPSYAIFNADPAERDATRDTGLKAAAVRREAMRAVIRNMTTLLMYCKIRWSGSVSVWFNSEKESRRRSKHFDDENKEKGNTCLELTYDQH